MAVKRITISGNAGSGKSTVAKLLAKQLNYEYVSIGDFSRKYAQEHFNMNINEFQDYCNQHPEEDKMIDEKFMEYCNSKESLVIDYRLGFHFVKDSFNILLNVSDAEAAKRIQNAGRTGENTTTKCIRQRNMQMRLRFFKIYKVDYLDHSNYDTVITSDTLKPENIVTLIVAKLKFLRMIEHRIITTNRDYLSVYQSRKQQRLFNLQFCKLFSKVMLILYRVNFNVWL